MSFLYKKTQTANNTNNSRSIIIDLLKSIAIILVVIGHIVSKVYDQTSYANNTIFCICYSFHMPLFIFLSAFLNGKKEINKFNGSWIKKRLYRLVIPYCIWAIIYAFYDLIIFSKFNITNLLYEILNNLFVESSPWFLINLFICDMSLFFAYKVLSKTNDDKIKALNISIIVFIIYYLIWILVYVFFEWSIAKNMVLFYPYYISGFIVPNYKKIHTVFIGKSKWIFLFLYPLSMILYTYSVELAGEKSHYLLSILNIHGHSAEQVLKYGIVLFSRYVVGFLGIAFVYVLFKYLLSLSVLELYLLQLAKIGKITMYIYLISYFFNLSPFEDNLCNAILSFVLSMVIPIVCYCILKRLQPIRKLLFG